MARYIGAVCRLCRREDMKLFLKGERCYTDKCGYERRSYPPGQHGQSRRKKRSNYGEQLREKHANFAMRKVTQANEIYPVFHDLFKKAGVDT